MSLIFKAKVDAKVNWNEVKEIAEIFTRHCMELASAMCTYTHTARRPTHKRAYNEMIISAWRAAGLISVFER